MNPLSFTLDHRAIPELAPELGARADVLGRFHEGKVKTLRFDADVWTDGKNKNHFRFPEAELQNFAASFKGEPFLMDHSHELGKRGGTIIDSVLTEKNGRKVIRQTIEAVKPWAIEGVLDGTIDRFSVGWDFDQTLCTACNSSILTCAHLGQLGKRDRSTGKPVEVLWTGIKGIETSAVTNAAAEGTGQVLAQLSALAKELANGNGNASGISPEQEEEARMKEKVLYLLGLPANTAEPEALSALEARLSQKPGVPKALCTALGVPESASEAEVIGKVIGMSAPGAFVAKAEHDRVVSEFSGMKADGKVAAALASGKLTPAMEPWAKEFARTSPDAFDAFLASAPQQVPVGAPVPPMELSGKSKTLTAEESIVARAMGLTGDEFLKAKDEVAQSDARIAALYH